MKSAVQLVITYFFTLFSHQQQSDVPLLVAGTRQCWRMDQDAMTSCLTCTGLIEKDMSWFLVPNSVLVSKPNLHSNTLCQSWLDSALLCLTAQAVPRLQWPQPLCPAGSAPWGWAQTQPCTEPAAELCWGKTAQILSCMLQNPRCVC